VITSAGNETSAAEIDAMIAMNANYHHEIAHGRHGWVACPTIAVLIIQLISIN
jgi:hypothetical protein